MTTVTADLARALAAPATHETDDFERHPKTGAIIASSLNNIRRALVLLNVTLVYDTFSRVVLLSGQPVDDAAIGQLWVAINDTYQFRPSKDVLLTLIDADARKTPIHPVRRYLDGLHWDGIPRVDTWLANYAGAANTAYVRAVGALPLIAAVRRVRQPGCKFDELLVLESDQGMNKSTGVRTLCPDKDWFAEDVPLGVDSKIVIERTSGKWIIEAQEMHGNRGRDVETLKAFLSRQTDGPVRLAYGRLPVTVPRQFIIVGTTNTKLGYLKDATGARRFWPVRVKEFDIKGLDRDRDQLWAEAAAREAAGASIRLAQDLWAAAGEQQEARRGVDPWEPILAELFEGDGLTIPNEVPVATVWKTLGKEAKYLVNRDADRVAAIAQRFGFNTKKNVRIKGTGKVTSCWVRFTETSDT